MKKFIYLSTLFLFSSFFGIEMRAQDVLSAGEVTILPGETVTVSVEFANATEGLSSFVYKGVFPTWLSITNPSFNKARTDDPSNPDLSISLESGSDDTWIFWYNASDPDTYSITGNEGVLFTFDLVADNTAPEGESVNITFTPQEFLTVDIDDVDVTINPLKVNVGIATAESEDITLANEDSYNSYCSDKDLDFTSVENAEAYVVTAVSATEATLTKVDAVPAGEGFLILGKDASSISVPVAAEKPAATGTLLVGVTTATEIGTGNFGLATDGSKFVPLLAGTVPANKAYLPASAAPELGAKEFMLVIDGIEVTGISEIQTESKANGAIYNLNGARVSAPQKGVYIMNGRKVIVK